MSAKNSPIEKPQQEGLVITRIFACAASARVEGLDRPRDVYALVGAKGIYVAYTARSICASVASICVACVPLKGKDFWSTGVYREIVPFEANCMHRFLRG